MNEKLQNGVHNLSMEVQKNAKELPKTLKILPKWRNVSKFGHTVWVLHYFLPSSSIKLHDDLKSHYTDYVGTKLDRQIYGDVHITCVRGGLRISCTSIAAKHAFLG